MPTYRTWLLAASTILFATACSTPEERMAKLQLKQQRIELKAQQLAQRNEARNTQSAGSAAAATAVTDLRAPLDNVIKALASCDATFSATLRQFAPELQQFFPVTLKGENAVITVPARKTPGSTTVRATGDARAFGMPISGYYDESIEINGIPQKLSWGFTTPATPEQVSAVLGTNVRIFKSMSRELNGDYTRMEIFKDNGWHRTTRFDYFRGQANVLGERSLSVTPSRDPAFPGSRIGCLVRGLQTPQLQDSLRPELK